MTDTPPRDPADDLAEGLAEGLHDGHEQLQDVLDELLDRAQRAAPQVADRDAFREGLHGPPASPKLTGYLRRALADLAVAQRAELQAAHDVLDDADVSHLEGLPLAERIRLLAVSRDYWRHTATADDRRPWLDRALDRILTWIGLA